VPNENGIARKKTLLIEMTLYRDFKKRMNNIFTTLNLTDNFFQQHYSNVMYDFCLSVYLKFNHHNLTEEIYNNNPSLFINLEFYNNKLNEYMRKM
jgi:hypothetical protein